MKVTLKELSGATWQLEVEANETVCPECRNRSA